MEEFCNPGNLQECLELISNHLHLRDFEKLKYSLTEKDNLLVELCNYLWAVLKKEKNAVLKLNECKDCIALMTSQVDHYELKRKCYENSIKEHLNEITALQSKLSLKQSEINALNDQLKVLRTECTKLLNSAGLDRKLPAKVNVSQKTAAQKPVASVVKIVDPNEVVSSNFSMAEFRSAVPNIMDSCIKALDNTIQHLLTENATIRSEFLNVFEKLVLLYREASIKNNVKPISVSSPESLFELHSTDFLEKLSVDFSLVFDGFRCMLF